MQQTRQSSREEEAMMAAPEPVLGLEPDPAQERRFVVPSRVALGFAIAACVLALLSLSGSLFGFRMGFASLVLVGVCWAIGLELGVYTRRTNNGKAAIILSLLLLLSLGVLTL